MTLSKLMRRSNPKKGDVLFSKVALLMHMDGDNDGVVFTDVKGGAIIPTNVVTKTAVKHSGTSSAYFGQANSSLRVSSPLISSLGTGEFSLEMTFYPEITSIFGLYMNGSGLVGGYEWGVYVYAGYLRFYIGRAGSSQFDIGVAKAFVVGQKYRINIERTSGGVWWFYINDVAYTPILLVANGGGWNPNMNIASNQPCYIGCSGPGVNPFKGFIDEVRLTIGDSRGRGQPMVDTGLPFPDF